MKCHVKQTSFFFLLILLLLDTMHMPKNLHNLLKQSQFICSKRVILCLRFLIAKRFIYSAFEIIDFGFLALDQSVKYNKG